MKRASVTLITSISLLLLPAPMLFLGGCIPKASTQQQLRSQLSPQQLQEKAEKITVRVMAGDTSGSGILVTRAGTTYTVVTNDHVIASQENIRIATADGKIHSVQLISIDNEQEDDVAVLQFEAEEDYQLADLTTVEDSSEKKLEILAAGFPDGSEKISFSNGKVEELLEKPIAGGYLIGYTSEIQPGMSGGPVLNTYGEVIGINGISAYPLVPNYRYSDGSEPTKAQQTQMESLNWGIPVATLVAFVPGYGSSALLEVLTPENLTGVAAEVQQIGREITVRIENERDNGSGVIIAKRGKTYYVLTADHVVRNEGKYQVFTPDGQGYEVDYSTVKRLPGVDLAVLQFKSKENYRVAELGDYYLANEQFMFVSGWAGAKYTQLGKPKQLFSSGQVFSQEEGTAVQTESFYTLGAGYELTYTNLTFGGMSGGAVLDTQGRLIGIHAAAEAEQSPYSGEFIPLGYSLGVPVGMFLSLLDRADVKTKWLKVDESPPSQLTAAEKTSIEAALLTPKTPGKNATAEDWLIYGNRLWRKFDYDEAIAAYDQAIKLDEDFYLAWYAKGVALSIFGKEDYPAAVAAFDKVTKIQPDVAKAWRHRGQALNESEKYQEALSSFDRAIALNPKDFYLHIERGLALNELERYEEAIAAYNEAIKLNPEHPWAYNNRGLAKKEQGNLEGAIADYNQALQINPNSTSAYVNRGGAKYEQGDLEGAIADFNRAIKIDPNIALSYYNRGTVKVDQGDLEGAIADYNQALKINPQYADAYNNRGNVKADQGDLDGAIADYNQALKINPKDAQAYYNRGNAKYNQGDFDGAIADYNQALKINPKYALAYYNRGNAKEEQGNLDGAIADYNQALKINPKYADAYTNRGLVKADQGDLDGAIADYNQALQINPK
ncbi:MAG: tetratricopeptide repeat protein, partial [Oscillatoria sp. PMC 1050.18]|nr:tetratricopeptide repeat protein [Oscillatoria sp. PMC 1050.18]